MPIAFGIELLIQLFFVSHAMRSGKDKYWIFIIMAFPGLGCLAYFLMEYLPEAKHSPHAKRARSGIMDMVKPGRRLQYWMDQVEITPSVHNKKELAREYINSGQFDRALELYNQCLEGIYKDDRTVIEGICCAYYFQGDYENAESWLLRLKEIRNNAHDNDFDLLYARVLEHRGKTEDALDAYASLIRKFTGEEARCRYASLLKQCGKVREAREIYQDVLKHARLNAKYYKKTQKQWIAIAKKEIQEMG